MTVYDDKEVYTSEVGGDVPILTAVLIREGLKFATKISDTSTDDNILDPVRNKRACLLSGSDELNVSIIIPNFNLNFHMLYAMGSRVVRATDSRPEGLGLRPDAITWSVAKSPHVAEQCDVNIQSINQLRPDATKFPQSTHGVRAR
ncbi:hypothetical protein TNCV_4597611 [Trichonephila clavipes]|nr:hypothetical protein TNCV_4597611 [Trichonephila clavipes]